MRSSVAIAASIQIVRAFNRLGQVALAHKDASTLGAEAEIKCLNFQIDVLRRIGAPASMLRYLADLAKNHVYQKVGRNKTEFGVGTKDDICKERNW